MGKGCRVVLQMGRRDEIECLRGVMGAEEQPELGEWAERKKGERKI